MTEEEISKLRAFARAAIKGAMDASIDSVDVQDLAEKHGLIELVPYDPEKHGSLSDWDEDVEPGDTIYVLVDWMKEKK